MSPMVSGCLARGVVRAATVLLVALLPASLPAAAPGPSGPAAPAEGREKCPVCGMFVTMFPDWVCSIEFKDGTKALTDGPKDMFKYYLNVGKYRPSKGKKDIVLVTVKDYRTKAPIDGRKAFFVIWSDLYGPMGHEPIPFAREAEARKFLKEHKAKKVIRFNEVTSKLLWSLDNPP